MNIKVIVCYLILVVLGTLISCKKQPPKRNNEFDKTLYTIQKDGTLIHKKDFEVMEAINIYCRKIFTTKKKYSNHLLYKFTPRVRNLELRSIPAKGLQKIINHAQHLDSLKALTLSKIDITQFPDLSNLSSLKRLRLKQVYLGDTLVIPAYLSQVTHLTVSNSGLKNIVFPSGSKLIVLNLLGNQLKSLDASFSYLRKLEGLRLQRNLLCNIMIPGDFSQLETIDLCDNPIRTSIQKKMKEKHPNIVFNFCPDLVEFVFSDSLKKQ